MRDIERINFASPILDTYRETREVSTLSSLVVEKDRSGIVKLMDNLKTDFNGDVLEPTGANVVWKKLSDKALEWVDDFLQRVDMLSGQRSFWRYDFRYIPVELISGIYESFLSDKKRDEGAYYTPRNLAVLAVDQAFSTSEDILAEKIYDGACGSGILLTTAYRRMLALAEARAGKQLSFAERIELLTTNIFGSDLNKSACRVTAFSLYLSLLENLEPSDIVRLTAQGKSTLPTLTNTNIFYEDQGDFFSDNNPLVTSGKFTILISNPPWVEPKGKEILTSDSWAEANGFAIARRQVCAAFMLRATKALDPTRGRLCFILPVSILAAPTSQAFVRLWLEHCQLDTVINFGDLRKLLFDQAKQPTLLVTARPRQKKKAQYPEVFEYWTPKADLSFAFNRLTLHGADRNVVQTQQLRQDNTILTSLYWGTPRDVAVMARLEMGGTFADLLKRDGWANRKGFHKLDSSVDAEKLSSVRPIKNLRYLNARAFGMTGPLLDETVLEDFPTDLTHVPNLSTELLEAFKGPRIVFKDGMTPEREVCAAYSSRNFSFSSSTAVITAPERDADVLKFLAVYLHSDLVRYLLLLTAYQVSFERERVALLNIKRLPFVHPEDHPDPEKALRVMTEISSIVAQLEEVDPFERGALWEQYKPRAEELVADYVGLDALERARVKEVMDYVLPSLQPSNVYGLNTPLQHRASDAQFHAYTTVLLSELSEWRDATGGKGKFSADIVCGSAQSCGALAILRLDVGSSERQTQKLRVADDAAHAVVVQLRKLRLLPVQLHGNFHIASDVVIRHEDSLYLVKPMVRRLWLQSEAVRDALRIVNYVQEAASAEVVSA